MGVKAPPVLIVDDNTEFAELVGTLVAEQGFTPIVAHNAHNALTLARLYSPAAIVLDLLLPDMTGHKLMKELARPAGPPVFVMTGVFKGQAQMEKVRALGRIAGWFEKPFDTRVLVEELARAVGHAVIDRGEHKRVGQVTPDFDIDILDPVEVEGIRGEAPSRGSTGASRPARPVTPDMSLEIEVDVEEELDSDEQALALWDVVESATPSRPVGRARTAEAIVTGESVEIVLDEPLTAAIEAQRAAMGDPSGSRDLPRREATTEELPRLGLVKPSEPARAVEPAKASEPAKGAEPGRPGSTRFVAPNQPSVDLPGLPRPGLTPTPSHRASESTLGWLESHLPPAAPPEPTPVGSGMGSLGLGSLTNPFLERLRAGQTGTIPPVPTEPGTITPEQVRAGLRAKMRAGNLKPATVARLLTAFYISRETGEIAFERGGERKVVYLAEGRPVYARSNQDTDRLGAIAKRAFGLDTAQLERALHVARATERMIGDVLIEQGLIEEARRPELVREQTRTIIRSLLTWSEGRYVIGFNASAEIQRAVLDDHPAALVLAAIRDQLELAQLRVLVPDRLVPMPSPNPPYELHELPLGDAEALLVLRATGTRTAAELLHHLASRLPEQAARALIHALLVLGVLVAGRAPAVARSPARLSP